MKSLKSLLEKRKKEAGAILDEKDIFYIFHKVIKEEYGNIGSGKFETAFFKNKTLFIKSESSAWASELWMNKEKIIEKIKEELGEGAVEKIKVK